MKLRVAVLVLGCASLSGCFTPSWQKHAAKPTILGFPRVDADGSKHEPRLVGHVAMVSTAGKFVLLECDAWAPPAAGTALKCFRYGAETAILNAGSEHRSSYVVADIVKGEPQRGDEVFQ